MYNQSGRWSVTSGQLKPNLVSAYASKSRTPDPNHAVPADHLALVANLLDPRPDLHDCCCFPSESLRPYGDRALAFNWPLATGTGHCYLYRYTIRPRVGIDGDSSTATRSPGKDADEVVRILPETCVST